MGWFGNDKHKTSDYEPPEKEEEEETEEEEESDDMDEDQKQTLTQFEYAIELLEKMAEKDKLYAKVIDFKQSPWTDKPLSKTTKQEIIDGDADSDQIETAFNNIIEAYELLMFGKNIADEGE